MAACQVLEVSRARAMAAIVAARIPVGVPTSAHWLTEGGACMELRTDDGSMVFVVRREGDALWVDAAAATSGARNLAAGLPLADEIARQLGCRRVAFDTLRPGLVRRARRAGYCIDARLYGRTTVYRATKEL